MIGVCTVVLEHIITLHASKAAAQCIVIAPVCLYVCLWVCYHDNSKLRASILTKLGLQVKVVTIFRWLNIGCPAPREGHLQWGEIFGSVLLQPACSVFVSCECFFIMSDFTWYNSMNVSSCGVLVNAVDRPR